MRRRTCGWLETYSLVGAVLVVASFGCSSATKETPPSNGLRSATSGVNPLGLDDRARQIESNLGVR